MGEGRILKEVKPLLLRTWELKGVKGKLKLELRQTGHCHVTGSEQTAHSPDNKRDFQVCNI